MCCLSFTTYVSKGKGRNIEMIRVELFLMSYHQHLSMEFYLFIRSKCTRKNHKQYFCQPPKVCYFGWHFFVVLPLRLNAQRNGLQIMSSFSPFQSYSLIFFLAPSEQCSRHSILQCFPYVLNHIHENVGNACRLKNSSVSYSTWLPGFIFCRYIINIAYRELLRFPFYWLIYLSTVSDYRDSQLGNKLPSYYIYTCKSGPEILRKMIYLPCSLFLVFVCI